MNDYFQITRFRLFDEKKEITISLENCKIVMVTNSVHGDISDLFYYPLRTSALLYF